MISVKGGPHGVTASNGMTIYVDQPLSLEQADAVVAALGAHDATGVFVAAVEIDDDETRVERGVGWTDAGDLLVDWSVRTA